ncbi:hypothetical protein BH10PSE2_BH10PSE2_15670 [soil metagenome]
MASWFFWLAVVAWALTLFLAFYLDFRRYNLVQLGQLPASTPMLLRHTWGTGLASSLETIEYVFSRDFAHSPDAPTRFWVPALRAGLIVSAVSIVLALVSGLWFN